ncbi:MFS transporter [Paenibacillus physcomitrellae]|uniref:MFS transporter n=2 Tax=Paenibacillus physcomitrellae TaxID=1619311 RepID=A0ABQ1G2G2_9BACL|nr:MFS transporter [Paenibacillus physcomitrellae]
MGLLTAASTAPYFLIGLFAGVWVDRVNRLPILKHANLISGLLLCLIPLLHALDWLTIESLYILAFLTAACSMVFQFAYQAFLPSIVSKEELTEGNSKLEATRAAAQFAGPSAAGGLIQALTAPFAIWVDVATYFLSIWMFGRIKTVETMPAAPRKSIFLQIKSGFSLIVSNSFLRTIAYSTALLNFSRCSFDAVYMLFLVHKLSLNASHIGLIYGIGSLGALFGAMAASRMAAKVGIGLAIIGSSVLIGVGYLLVSAASGNLLLILPLLILAQMCSSMGNTVYYITQVSLRQAVTPNDKMGRVNSAQTFISRGAVPLGALLGGLLGTWAGLRGTLVLAGCMSLMTLFLLIFSPVRKVRQITNLEEPEASRIA